MALSIAMLKQSENYTFCNEKGFTEKYPVIVKNDLVLHVMAELFFSILFFFFVFVCCQYYQT